MASKATVKDDGKIEIVALDGAYAKELPAKQKVVETYYQYKKHFQQVLKMVGASGKLPMDESDYKKLSGAKDLKKLVREMYDMQAQAKNPLLDIAFVTNDLDKLIDTDADAVTQAASKTVNDEIKDLESQVAALQKKIAALNKLKSEMKEKVKSALKSDTKDIVVKLEALKKDVPEFKSGMMCFDFDMHNKHLRAKMK